MSQSSRTDTPALTRCHFGIIGSKPLLHTITARPYPYYPKTLGDHLRKRRLDLNLTQKHLAEEILHTSTSNVRNWEANRRAVSLRFRRSVNEFIGLCPCDLSLSFGRRLKVRREYLGLSLKRLSMILGADPDTIAGWENELHEPSNRHLKRIRLFMSRKI